MNKRSYKLFFQDIISSIEKIEEYIHKISYEEFIENKMMYDAVIRNLEIIGEATKNIPDNIKKQYPNLPWKRMSGLRDIVAHEYFGIDTTIIWKVITQNLPEVKGEIVRISNNI